MTSTSYSYCFGLHLLDIRAYDVYNNSLETAATTNFSSSSSSNINAANSNSTTSLTVESNVLQVYRPSIFLIQRSLSFLCLSVSLCVLLILLVLSFSLAISHFITPLSSDWSVSHTQPLCFALHLFFYLFYSFSHFHIFFPLSYLFSPYLFLELLSLVLRPLFLYLSIFLIFRQILSSLFAAVLLPSFLIFLCSLLVCVFVCECAFLCTRVRM